MYIYFFWRSSCDFFFVVVVDDDDDDDEVIGGIYDEEDTANLILSNAFCISLSNDSVKSLDLKTESD